MEDIGSRLGGNHDMTPIGSPNPEAEKPQPKPNANGLRTEQQAFKDGYRKGKRAGNFETLVAIFMVTAIIVVLALW